MEPEINASEYSSPAKLAEAIQRNISQLYVDWVWVNFHASRQKVTPSAVDNVCKGLLMANIMSADQENGDTPETDALENEICQLASRGEAYLPLLIQCRKLERGRAAARRMVYAGITPQDIAETMPPRQGHES